MLDTWSGSRRPRARGPRLAIALLLVLGTLAAPARSAAASADPRPSFVVIMTDDQDDVRGSLDAELPGGGYVLARVRERILRRGTRFTNSFVTFPLCCPARASFLDGRYNHNNQVLSGLPPNGGFPAFDDSEALPVWLERAGYRNGYVGKYLNAYDGSRVPPGWELWYAIVQPAASPGYYNYRMYDGASIVEHGNGPQDYSSDVITVRALRFLDRLASSREPFYLQVGYVAPHTDPNTPGFPKLATPAPHHLGTMEGVPTPMPPSFDERDVSDKPPHVQALPPFSAADVANVGKGFRRRMEALRSVDEGVERIVARLEELGLLESTILVFTSDNGWMQGEHRIKVGKEIAYEESARVPLILRGPGIPEGGSIDRLVTNLDFAPTIAEWAGAVPGGVLDGRSLVPLIADPGLEGWRTDFLIENPIDLHYAALRTQDPATGEAFKYVEHDRDRDGLAESIELYALTPNACDPVGDPFELESRHADPCHAELVRRLHLRLAHLKACAGAGCE